MVAPHETGDLVRSLVRVPGSGSDRTAGSECLDLARVSSLAATVPVPKTLPAALATLKVAPKPQNSRNEKLVGKTGPAVDLVRGGAAASSIPTSNGEDHKRKLHEESSESENSGVRGASVVPKRARVVYMTREQVMSHSDRIVPISTAAGPVLFLPLQQPSTSNASSAALVESTISQLIAERDTLRQENQQLQHQLSLFQQLFKDKQRLGSVVKRLGVKIP